MNFSKMHGLGNDFIVIENMDNYLDEVEKLAKVLCDRHTGIGADGILLVEPSNIADIRMRIINSDGSHAQMCGNGLRCFVKYVYDKGIVDKQTMSVETMAGVMICELRELNGECLVKVNMGKPNFTKQAIPFVGEDDNKSYTIVINGNTYKAATLLMGVPHTIVYVNQIDNEEIVEYGQLIENMDIFPDRTNVNFVKVIDNKHIAVKTWERGAGMTLACGTGTCASAVAACVNGFTDKNVEAQLELGNLNINFDGINVFMEGPAELVFHGEVKIQLTKN